MDLIIPGSPDDVYTLPESLLLKDNDFSIRHESVNVAFADGAALFGREVQTRDVQISGKVWTPTREAHRTLMDQIAARCTIPDQRLQIEDGYWMPLKKLKDFRASWTPLRDRSFSEVQIVFAASDPYWYAEDEVTATYTPTGNTILTPNPASGDWPARQWVSPVITITAPGAGSVPSVRLQNLSDGGLQLQYADLNLRNGAVVVIDCANGTVTRNGTDSIQFLDGEFIRLLAQANQISYTGAACTISFKWRPRWV